GSCPGRNSPPVPATVGPGVGSIVRILPLIPPDGTRRVGVTGVTGATAMPPVSLPLIGLAGLVMIRGAGATGSCGADVGVTLAPPPVGPAGFGPARRGRPPGADSGGGEPGPPSLPGVGGPPCAQLQAT